MSEASLVTVEITITDVDPPLSIVLGGPKKQSNDMARALAERFGVPPVPRGRMLGLNMTPAELQDVLPWLKEQFPRIGFSSDPKATRSALLTSAPPSDRAPISPWRRFSVAGADDVTMDQETVTSIAALVDLLYQQRASWGCPSGRSAQSLKKPACGSRSIRVSAASLSIACQSTRCRIDHSSRRSM